MLLNNEWVNKIKEEIKLYLLGQKVPMAFLKKNKIPRNKFNHGCNRLILRKLKDTEEGN